MTTTFDPPRGAARTGTGRQLWALLEGRTEDLDAAVELPLFALETAELTGLIELAEQAKARVEALQSRLVAEATDRDLPREAGANSMTGWLTTRLRLPGAAASRMANTARVLSDDRVDLTRVAWARGRLSGQQARVIADAVCRLGSEVDAGRVAAAQADLIERAQELTFTELRHAANRVVEVVDPEGAEQHLGEQLEAEEERARKQATFRFSRRGDGTTALSGRLPDAHADMFKKALDAFGAPRRLAAQDGETVPPADGQDGMVSSPVLNPDGDHSEPLTYGNRLGLALMELVEHLPTDRLPSAGGGSATVVVTMTLEQLRSGLGSTALDTGVEASAGQARRLACNAQLVPMVLGGDSQPLDLGRARRLFSPPQRLALAHRDGGCVWRGCARPPSWCEAHHPHPWSEGGPTDVRNGALLCPFHHRLLHTGDWVLRIARDGIPEVIPPARIDEARRPMRHARFTRPPGRHPD